MQNFVLNVLSYFLTSSSATSTIFLISFKYINVFVAFIFSENFLARSIKHDKLNNVNSF